MAIIVMVEKYSTLMRVGGSVTTGMKNLKIDYSKLTILLKEQDCQPLEFIILGHVKHSV
jgi:hypothetical protein